MYVCVSVCAHSSSSIGPGAQERVATKLQSLACDVASHQSTIDQLDRAQSDRRPSLSAADS